MRIICDFDGTITRQDSTDLVLETLADPEWQVLQAEWVAGRLSGADCMAGQVALIGGSARDLDAILDTVELDPGFLDFVAWCEARGLELRIVSDGVDYFISRILARHGLGRLTAVANRLTGEAGAWGLQPRRNGPDCAAGSGVCKCAAAALDAPDDDTLVFVGDGRSDFCIAGRADVLFAKGQLAAHADGLKRPYLPFDTFDDVRRSLSVLVDDLPVSLRARATA
jgi:2-hydroxy-3-keto-5-methylthiopentenyl-1-phosphate phosphatase